jgi:ATP-dependent DNA helicase RecQ
VLRTAEKANRVLFETEAVLWRHAASKQTRPGRKPAAAGGPGAAEQSLFDRLRGLRAELARQAGVPAYVIFHDASLLKLAELQPATELELLTVSGVGEQKAKKYGRAVLAVIAEWKLEQQGKKSSKAKKKEPQPPLHLRPEQLARYVCDPDGISMTEFARRLTALKEEGEAGELTGRQLSEQLLTEGYLKEQSAETDNLRRRPTPAGESVGITLTERSGKDGRAFTMVTLTEEAQRWLIDRLSEGLIME